jgi:DNA-binding sugar fermentation-stimulating protein
VIIRCDIIRASVPRCRILPRKCPAGYLTIFCRRFLIGEIEFSLGFADCVSSRGSETRSALRRLVASKLRPLCIFCQILVGKQLTVFVFFHQRTHQKVMEEAVSEKRLTNFIRYNYLKRSLLLI